jgi:hypothetical protein
MISDRDLVWAAGFLEGEGCFYTARKNPNGASGGVTAAQVQRWPLDKLRGIFGGSIALRRRQPPANDAWYWGLYGRDAVGLMMTLYGLLSPKRQAQIRAFLPRWKARPVMARFRSVCANGHPYDEKNTRRLEGRTRRQCRICSRAASARWRDRRRALKAS